MTTNHSLLNLIGTEINAYNPHSLLEAYGTLICFSLETQIHSIMYARYQIKRLNKVQFNLFAARPHVIDLRDGTNIDFQIVDVIEGMLKRRLRKGILFVIETNGVVTNCHEVEDVHSALIWLKLTL